MIGLYDCRVFATGFHGLWQYVAICNPLLYMVVMSPGIRVQLVAAPIAIASWLPYFIPSSPFTSPTAIPMSSIISIAMACLFSVSLAQTLTPSSYGFLPCWSHVHFLPSDCLCLLHVHSFCHPKDVLRWRQMQGFFHLWLPHAGSHHILWDPHLYVLTAKF